MKQKIVNLITLNSLILTLILTVGFTNKNLSPKTLYRVYLEGKYIGLI